MSHIVSKDIITVQMNPNVLFAIQCDGADYSLCIINKITWNKTVINYNDICEVMVKFLLYCKYIKETAETSCFDVEVEFGDFPNIFHLMVNTSEDKYNIVKLRLFDGDEYSEMADPILDPLIDFDNVDLYENEQASLMEEYTASHCWPIDFTLFENFCKLFLKLNGIVF